ncbi:class I SAM-dependent methyltransferase [Streptomyces sp. NPDC046727]|uniref:class I SAM-dependent DNA methyltransferase n=1 Tax=Streptomyces sp. NPDC046727 TaxID=3155373 RepID=UPI0033E56DB6
MSESTYLSAVQESYDGVADAYARRTKTPAELDPVSRAMLAAFAESARTVGRGPVADLGCGPGRVTAHLAGLGLRAFGMDLSPRMVELARRAYPGIPFLVGSLTALGIRDGGLGGILAYYSTHHTPPGQLPGVFREFHRTLAPGGCLMLAGPVGDDQHRRPATAYGGRPVRYDSYLVRPDRIEELLEASGLEVFAHLLHRVERNPERTIGTFLARKPEA